MALSWQYLLQMCLLIMFLAFVSVFAISWLMYYWNDQIIHAEKEIYRANRPEALAAEASEEILVIPWGDNMKLGDVLDIEKARAEELKAAADAIDSNPGRADEWGPNETAKLLEKRGDGHYKWKIDPGSGKIILNDHVSPTSLPSDVKYEDV